MFNVGDEVVLTNLLGDDGEYGADVITPVGTVIDVIPNIDYAVRVQWGNGKKYRYKEVDLSLHNFTLENE